jgi:hypothetical protein
MKNFFGNSVAAIATFVGNATLVSIRNERTLVIRIISISLDEIIDIIL